MPTKAKVITAILNWNGSKMLQKFLPSVVKYSTGEDRAVAVIDNCSDDDSVDVLKAQFPEVEIITLDRNYGFAEVTGLPKDTTEAWSNSMPNTSCCSTPMWK